MKVIVEDPCIVFDSMEPDNWPGNLEADGPEGSDKVWTVEIITLDQLHDLLLVQPGNFVTADVHLFAPLGKKQVFELRNLGNL